MKRTELNFQAQKDTEMGSLKPGATYIYERVDDVVYAREFGSLEREAIGWDYKDEQSSSAHAILREAREWREILEAAKDNQALQEAIDRVKILYHLSKDHGQE